jgi:hypothetical protein
MMHAYDRHVQAVDEDYEEDVAIDKFIDEDVVREENFHPLDNDEAPYHFESGPSKAAFVLSVFDSATSLTDIWHHGHLS